MLRVAVRGKQEQDETPVIAVTFMQTTWTKAWLLRVPKSIVWRPNTSIFATLCLSEVI